MIRLRIFIIALAFFVVPCACWAMQALPDWTPPIATLGPNEALLAKAIHDANYDLLEMLLQQVFSPAMLNREIMSYAYQNPMGQAIARNDLPSVELLLKYQADPNFKITGHNNYLSVALSFYSILKENPHQAKNTEEIIKLLLKYGANPNALGRLEVTAGPRHYPLEQAIDLGLGKIAQLLLKYGAQPNLSHPRDLPLYRIICMQQNHETRALVDLLLLHGASIKKAMTIPSSVAELSDQEKLNHEKLFREKFSKIFDEYEVAALFNTVDQLAPVKPSAGSKDWNIGKFWEMFKNRVTLKLSNSAGMSSLHYAATQGHLEAINILISNKTPINALNKQGDTPADVAVRIGHTECAQALLNAGGTFNTQRWLRAAVRRKDTDSIKQLLKDKPELVNEQGNNGDTAVHLAGAQPYTPLLNELLNHNPDLNITNNQAVSPLHVIFTNCCPGDLLLVSTTVLESALTALAKSEIEEVACVVKISEIRAYIANILARQHLQEHNNSRVIRDRSLSVIKTMKALRVATNINRPAITNQANR
jgi:ankyrin repeat protein